MKQSTGKWVKPFNFTDVKRKELMRVWKRSADRQKAESFIGGAEKIVEDWLSFAEEQRTSAPKARAYAADILKAATALQQALDALPEDVVITLKACVIERLYVTESRRKHEKAARDLRCLFPGEQYPGLIEMAEVLESQLDLLGKAAEKLAVIESSSGVNKGAEKWLVDILTVGYKQHFGKPPSASNGSNFRKFLAELSKILGYDLGADIAREVVGNRQDSRQKLTQT